MLSSTCYDGQGFWLAQKRLSKGRFPWWPTGTGTACTIEAYQAQLLVAAGESGHASRTDVASSELISKLRQIFIRHLRSSGFSVTLLLWRKSSVIAVA